MLVGIVGGGIAGLTAAWELAQAGHETVVFEGSAHVGGKLRTGQVGGVTVDLGAESVLARRPEAVELIEAVGLGEQMVHPASGQASIWARGALRPMPPTVLGIPADLAALEASGIVTELEQRSVQVPDEDVCVADFVTERAGRDVVDYLVEPLLGGVYAGHASRLSLRAAAPQIAALGADPIAAAVAARGSASPSTQPVFAGIRGGIGVLAQTVAEASGAEIRRDCPVRLVERQGPDQWRILAGPNGAVEQIDVDAVIMAAPAPATARLIAQIAPVTAFILAGVDYASVALTTMIFPADLELTGSGFLVPPVEGRLIKASTFSSRKWEWVGQGSGQTVLRASVGRAGQSDALQLDDGALVRGVLADLNDAIGPLPEPVDVHVQRWGGSLPQYEVGHIDRMAQVRAEMADIAGVELCGAAYDGVGIPAVIASAREAVSRLLGQLAD